MGNLRVKIGKICIFILVFLPNLVKSSSANELLTQKRQLLQWTASFDCNAVAHVGWWEPTCLPTVTVQLRDLTQLIVI